MSRLHDDLFDGGPDGSPAGVVAGCVDEALDALVESVNATETCKARRPVVLSAGDIAMTAPPMLVRGWIPKGAITVLAGQPGAGKGVAVADLIARGSRGDPAPNGDRLARPFRSLIVCGPGEDSAADWQLRLVAANANATRYALIEHTVDDLGFAYPITASDLDPIVDRAVVDGFDLVVVDSLGSVAGDLDVNKTEVRDRMLNPLANRAKASGLALLLVHHTRKSGGDALTIVAGHTQIIAAARSVLVIAHERDDDNETRFLVTGKLNGARRSDPVAFTTTGRTIVVEVGNRLRDDRGDLVYVPAVQWSDRTVSNAEAAAAMAGLPAHRDDAADTLREVLVAGPMRSPEVDSEMSEAGYTRDQTKRARQRIGASSIKVGTGTHAGWWTLPPGMPKTEGRTVIEEQQGGTR